MGTRTNKTKLLKAFSAALLTVLLMPTLSFPVLADYIHGYFRYETEDQSVTITAYTGKEESVTVPSVIGGNPVNTIAAGAFAGCESVKTVYLPDTISCVEEGAFSPEQTVVFAAGEPSPEEPVPSPAAAVGISTPDSGLITADDEGNLLWVDSSGNETVLDNTGEYTAETGEDGCVFIRDQNGTTVSVENGVVSFKKEDKEVKVNTQTGVITEYSRDEDASFEEAEPEDVEQIAPEATQIVPTEELIDSEAAPPTEKTGISLTLPLILTCCIAAILLVFVLAFFLRGRKKDKKQSRK